jgi:hypothetical protein
MHGGCHHTGPNQPGCYVLGCEQPFLAPLSLKNYHFGVIGQHRYKFGISADHSDANGDNSVRVLYLKVCPITTFCGTFQIFIILDDWSAHIQIQQFFPGKEPFKTDLTDCDT